MWRNFIRFINGENFVKYDRNCYENIMWIHEAFSNELKDILIK